MKVNHLSELAIGNAHLGASKPQDRAVAPQTSGTEAAPEASVSVKFSPVTQTMTNGVARSGTDVFNAEKVQQMRMAIENGSFSVNPEAIADKLLTNAREMLSSASAN